VKISPQITSQSCPQTPDRWTDVSVMLYSVQCVTIIIIGIISVAAWVIVYRTLLLLCEVCCAVIDVAFVVDSSSKPQGQSTWTLMMSFVNFVLDRLSIAQHELRVSFVSYGDRANVEFRLSQYNDRQSAKQRIRSVRYLGSAGSNLPDALDALRNQVFQTNAGARSLAPWVAVIVTDRSPTIRAQQLVSVASQVRGAGIQIIPVGVIGSGQLNRNILTQIAFTQTQLTTVIDYNQLAGVASQVSDWICQSYLSECDDALSRLKTAR